MYDHKTGKKGGKWDHTQQVRRIIFGENMKLLIEGLKGQYLLTLTCKSFVCFESIINHSGHIRSHIDLSECFALVFLLEPYS